MEFKTRKQIEKYLGQEVFTAKFPDGRFRIWPKAQSEITVTGNVITGAGAGILKELSEKLNGTNGICIPGGYTFEDSNNNN